MADIRDLVGLEDRVAIVTGGARGIGRETAEMLARAGAHVAVADLDKATAEATAATMAAAGFRAFAITVDVADEASVDAMVEATLESEGRVDILINNAGIAIRRPAVELALGDWDKVVAVNMTGAFLCARAAARPMTAAGGGAIVNVASIVGMSGGGLYPNISYQATKGAVVNMNSRARGGMGGERDSGERRRADLRPHRPHCGNPEGPRACRTHRGDDPHAKTRRTSRYRGCDLLSRKSGRSDDNRPRARGGWRLPGAIARDIIGCLDRS